MLNFRNFIRLIGRWSAYRVSSDSVDSRGPVFISYRHSDGYSIAADTAWAFRAAGVPVWHDQTDLPPGDTNRRLQEALESGLSGSVLLVTPEIHYSSVVRNIELPQLLRLADDQRFTFSILSIIEREPGKLDYGAPDELLGQRKKKLRNFKQEPAITQLDLAHAAREQCRRRMQAVRKDVEAAGRVLTMDVQTRIPPSAARVDSDLVLRLRLPLDGNRQPHCEGLEDLKLFLADLPQLVALAGAEHARIKGGAHLTVAFALGAALPTTLVGNIEVTDIAGHAWSLTGSAPVPEGENSILRNESAQASGARAGEILVYLDLLSARNDAAFEDFVTENSDRFAGAFHIRPIRQGNLRAEEASEVVGEASRIIRDFVGEYRTSEVHLLLRCPWPVALLLGRTLNTIRVHLYEWEDGPDENGNEIPPRYLPSLVVRSGAGGSPIERVVLPTPPEVLD